MTDLPGFPIDPLQPPSGAYEQMAERARSRRTRSALLAGGLALVMGVAGVGTATLLGGDGRDDALVAQDPTPTSEPTPATEITAAPTPTPTPTQSRAASAVTSGPEPSATTTPAVPDDQATDTHAGLVVDAAGRPLAGIYVYLLAVNAVDPRPADAVTDADGRFTVPCTSGRRALLSAWPIATRQPAGTPNLAPVFAGGAASWETAEPLRCGDVTTSMRQGATITGRIEREDRSGTPRPVPDHTTIGDGVYSDALDLQGAIIATWDPVGGRYRWTGMPVGSVLVSDATGSHGERLTVRAGQVVTLDWVVPCRCPSASPSQSPSATPSPAAA